MAIDEFCSKYNISQYRLAQIVKVKKSTLYSWTIRKKITRLPTWIENVLSLQDYYYSQNGKFLE